MIEDFLILIILKMRTEKTNALSITDKDVTLDKNFEKLLQR